MIEFFNRLFGRQNSGAMAKERLRLVLMSDHLSLAPEMIESMKRDLVDVISRYVEVDREKIDVHFENQDNALAMLANIPITGVNRNGGGSNGGDADGGAGGGDEHRDADEAEQTAKPQNGARSRRRRRKSGGGGAQASGTPAPAT